MVGVGVFVGTPGGAVVAVGPEVATQAEQLALHPPLGSHLQTPLLLFTPLQLCVPAAPDEVTQD